MHKYNFTYQTKNLVNGKTYIGIHSTNDLNDGYIGCGLYMTHLKRDRKGLMSAIDKYGIENFVMTPLCFFDTREEAIEEEEWLVNENWVNSKDNYNLILGGLGVKMVTPRKHTDKTKALIRKIVSGRKHSKKSKRKMELSSSHKFKPVEMLNKKGDVIKEFESVNSTRHDGYSPQNVSKVCSGIRCTHKGYKWRYKNKKNN